MAPWEEPGRSFLEAQKKRKEQELKQPVRTIDVLQTVVSALSAYAADYHDLPDPDAGEEDWREVRMREKWDGIPYVEGGEPIIRLHVGEDIFQIYFSKERKK